MTENQFLKSYFLIEVLRYIYISIIDIPFILKLSIKNKSQSDKNL